MTLQKYLMPEEQIRYEHPTKAKIGEIAYNIYITDTRLIGHTRKGLILKNDSIVTINLNDIKSLNYNEKGMLSKTGTLELKTRDMNFSIYGTPRGMNQLWQTLQSFMKKD